MSAPSRWDDPTITERARVLWLGGKSAAEVAKTIGLGLTRNAVISKMSRLGLVRDEEVRRVNHARAQSNGARPWASGKGKPKPATVPLTVKMTGKVAETAPSTLLGLPHGGCRWPVEGEHEDTLFCCVPAVRGPYCAGHARVAFVPDRPRSERDLQRLSLWA